IIPKKKNQSFLERLLLYIRGNFFIPDAGVLWVKPSIKFLEKYIQENKIETVITTGPPHSLHLIGLGLQKKFNIKWIADFRDPWTSIVYHKDLKLSAKSEKKHKELERKVLQSANQIVVTSPSTKAEFEQITPQPIEVITNGYDIEKSKNNLWIKSFHWPILVLFSQSETLEFCGKLFENLSTKTKTLKRILNSNSSELLAKRF